MGHKSRVNAFPCRRYNPSVFSACKTSRKSSSPYTGEPRFALNKATVMRTKILSVTPLNPLGVTAPLMNKGSQENGVNAIPCRGYNPSVFSACKTSRKASAPCTVGFRAPPVADTARKASRCRPQVRERIAEARAVNGEGAEIRTQCASARHMGAEFVHSSPCRGTEIRTPLLSSPNIPSKINSNKEELKNE